jgi:hypothetical protein
MENLFSISWPCSITKVPTRGGHEEEVRREEEEVRREVGDREERRVLPHCWPWWWRKQPHTKECRCL